MADYLVREDTFELYLYLYVEPYDKQRTFDHVYGELNRQREIVKGEPQEEE